MHDSMHARLHACITHIGRAERLLPRAAPPALALGPATVAPPLRPGLLLHGGVGEAEGPLAEEAELGLVHGVAHALVEECVCRCVYRALQGFGLTGLS